MEALTAWSTLVIAVFTVALVIVAGVNFQKFIENVKLVADSVKAQTRSIDLQNESLKAQTRSIDLQVEGLNAQAESINLQSDSLKSQTHAINLQNKDINLNYMPVVFIKGAIKPDDNIKDSDPYKHGFILTNTGKLPARNVRIRVIENQVSGTNIGINNSQSIQVLQKASVYPGTDLIFWVPKMIDMGKTDKAEFNFIISFEGEGLEGEFSESMKYIFDNRVSPNWIYVGPNVDIFARERADVNKRNEERENKIRK